jgi:hypothetical protein
MVYVEADVMDMFLAELNQIALANPMTPRMQDPIDDLANEGVTLRSRFFRVDINPEPLTLARTVFKGYLYAQTRLDVASGQGGGDLECIRVTPVPMFTVNQCPTFRQCLRFERGKCRFVISDRMGGDVSGKQRWPA